MEMAPIFYMDTNTDWIEGANEFAEQGSDLAGWIQEAGAAITKAVPTDYRGAVIEPEADAGWIKKAAAVMTKAVPTDYRGDVLEPGIFAAIVKSLTGADLGKSTAGGGGIGAGGGAVTGAPALPAKGLLDRLLDNPIALGLAIFAGGKILKVF